MKITDIGIGKEIETSEFLAFYGNRDSNINALEKKYLNFKFKRVKQVHGAHIVSTSLHSIDFSSEADAHYSAAPGLALCIATADCAPILVHCPTLKMALAIHAGWRGLEQRIIIKAFELLKKKGSDFSKLFISVGPHIQKSNFEVGNDVRDRLLKSISINLLPEASQNLFISTTESKSLVDLNTVIKLQLAEFKIPSDKILIEGIDTFSNNQYHSFRRDKEDSGRQISFIALKS